MTTCISISSTSTLVLIDDKQTDATSSSPSALYPQLCDISGIENTARKKTALELSALLSSSCYTLGDFMMFAACWWCCKLTVRLLQRNSALTINSFCLRCSLPGLASPRRLCVSSSRMQDADEDRSRQFRYFVVLFSATILFCEIKLFKSWRTYRHYTA